MSHSGHIGGVRCCAQSLTGTKVPVREISVLS